jgi:thiosulfate/3-mercaptopyruvate sulfurtransferase
MPTDAQAFRTLVSTDILAAHLDDPGWAIVDCRFELAETEAAEAAYRQEHIPGAVYAHLDRDLCAKRTGRNGRHPLPDMDAFTRRLGEWGVGPGVQVVAYDQDLGQYASRLWWMLRSLGHEAAAVLEGGFGRWVREGRPARSGIERREARRFAARRVEGRYVLADQVDAIRQDPAWLLIDSRAPERYRGETEPIDPVAGHIPGAVNRLARDNATEDGTLLPASELRKQFDALLGDVPPDRTVAYCGSGVFACYNLLAMEHAGLAGARLYAGSWSEWCSDPSRPVATTKR